jgi:N-acetylglucosamine-6-sulfatase
MWITRTSLLTFFTLLVCMPVWPVSAQQPNIVFILVDDLRYDTFGFMDHPFVETPHIDRLANNGAVFSSAFVTTSLCSPARASFLTGQYMHHHGVVDNQTEIPQGTVTFPQLLQKEGYQTAFMGKWHMGGASDAPRPGFDHWVSFRGQGTYFPKGQSLNVNGQQVPRQKYMTDELTDYAVAWLVEQTQDQRFLLYLSHKGVHGLYDPAPRHMDRYREQTWTPPASMEKNAENDRGKPLWVQDQRNSWHGVEYPYYGRSGQSLGEMYRHYCEMIVSIDESVGRVMEALQEQQLDGNTLVIFTSDGGHLWGEHGLIDKRCAYEESIRIPMVAHCPDLIPAGTRVDSVVANIDLAPTLLDYAGFDGPESMDGQSWRSSIEALKSPARQRRELLYEYYWEWSFPMTPTTFALRGERYKLIQYHGIWDTDELYDLEQDPEELVNLIDAPEHQQRVAQLRRELYERLKETGGLAMPLGFKRGPGSDQRNPGGTKRAPFPVESEKN